LKAVERGAPAVAILTALSALACCLPFGIVTALGLAGVGIWLTPLRPWLLGAAVLLLVVGFWQLYYRRGQCSVGRSRLSVGLFWLAVIVVLMVLLLPQMLAGWIAGN
jgi:hypothetical protein